MSPPTKQRDWYWECEPALVLADEGLADVKSPNDWPDMGLSCVGLYWYMLCIMHRSPRRGYLLDSRTLPMTTEQLAQRVHRPVEVVAALQEVLIKAGLFSADSHGTIYSRGMIRRESLRKKRAKSGRAGGLVTRNLLKQNAKQMREQNGQQMLRLTLNDEPDSSSGNDLGEPPKVSSEDQSPKPPGEISPADLAREWALRRKGVGKERIDLVGEEFSEMLKIGISTQFLFDAIKDRSRDFSEKLWQFRKRVEEQWRPNKRPKISAEEQAKLDREELQKMRKV